MKSAVFFFKKISSIWMNRLNKNYKSQHCCCRRSKLKWSNSCRPPVERLPPASGWTRRVGNPKVSHFPSPCHFHYTVVDLLPFPLRMNGTYTHRFFAAIRRGKVYFCSITHCFIPMRTDWRDSDDGNVEYSLGYRIGWFYMRFSLS